MLYIFMSTHPIAPFHTNLVKTNMNMNLFNLTKWIETEKKEHTETLSSISYSLSFYQLFLFLLFPPSLCQPKAQRQAPLSSFYLSAAKKKQTPKKPTKILEVLPCQKPTPFSLLFFFFALSSAQEEPTFCTYLAWPFITSIRDFQSWP